MQWIHQFQLVLFDFDGLLVNTEELHYLAYQRMCAARGINFDWSFDYYCQLAHYSADGLRRELYRQFPILNEQEPRWEILYAEKKNAIFNILNERPIQLMSGVEKLLQALTKANVRCCVVTNSPKELVDIVRKKNAILNTIPNWMTRERYTHPKPDPESYLKAIEIYGRPGDKIIGFEDTPRGLTALMGTPAMPILICTSDYPEIPALIARGARHFRTFEDVPDNLHV